MEGHMDLLRVSQFFDIDIVSSITAQDFKKLFFVKKSMTCNVSFLMFDPNDVNQVGLKKIYTFKHNP